MKLRGGGGGGGGGGVGGRGLNTNTMDSSLVLGRCSLEHILIGNLFDRMQMNGGI